MRPNTSLETEVSWNRNVVALSPPRARRSEVPGKKNDGSGEDKWDGTSRSRWSYGRQEDGDDTNGHSPWRRHDKQSLLSRQRQQQRRRNHGERKKKNLGLGEPDEYACQAGIEEKQKICEDLPTWQAKLGDHRALGSESHEDTRGEIRGEKRCWHCLEIPGCKLGDRRDEKDGDRQGEDHDEGRIGV